MKNESFYELEGKLAAQGRQIDGQRAHIKELEERLEQLEALRERVLQAYDSYEA
jgi:uncharacterized coiled-coil protein SlyX